MIEKFHKNFLDAIIDEQKEFGILKGVEEGIFSIEEMFLALEESFKKKGIDINEHFEKKGEDYFKKLVEDLKDLIKSFINFAFSDENKEDT